MMPPDQYGGDEFRNLLVKEDQLDGRVKNLERILGLLVNHPVLSKVVQGGPFAFPLGGALFEGKQLVGGAPNDFDVLTWSNTRQRYEPQAPNPVTTTPLFFAQGRYVGDGTAAKPIIGLGFRPKIVVIKANDATVNWSNAIFRSDTFTTTRTITNGGDSLDSILSLDTDGFTVKAAATAGTAGRSNETGEVYYWYAFGGSYIKTGTYSGDGINPHPVTGVGFQPAMLWIQHPTGGGTVHRTAAMATEDYQFSSDTGNANRIKSLDLDGFTLGSDSDVNFSGSTYHYIAWRLSTNFAVGTYTGTGGDDVSMPPVPLTFNPDMVHVKPDAGHTAKWKVAALGGDLTFDYSAGIAFDNTIQSVDIGGGQFQVGNRATGVNNAGQTEYYFAASTAIATPTTTIAVMDEGVALTESHSVDVIGSYIQAQEDAATAISRIRQGWHGAEAVVDSDQHVTLDSGTASSGGAGVLNDTTKAWSVNIHARAQVVITGGLGIGQVRTIISNSPTQLVVAAWTTNPDPTSTYLIQPNIRVYRKLIEAIEGGHRSISFRKSIDTTTVNITSSHLVNYILGDSPGDAFVPVAVTSTKTGVVFDALRISGFNLTLGDANVAVGCRIDSTNGRLILANVGASVIACTFVGAGGAGLPCIDMQQADQRVQACSFRLTSGTNLIQSTTANARRPIVVGCINIMSAETGYLIDFQSTANDASISGNILSVPLSATGAVRATGFASSVSANIIQANTSFTITGTWDLININSRSVVSSNTFRIQTISGGANTPVINLVHVIGVGVAVSGNVVFLNAISGANSVLNGILIDTNQRLTNIANNVFFALTVTAGTVQGVNPADAAAADLTMVNNTFVGGTATSAPFPWILITRMSQDTVLSGNTGVPPLSAWRHESIEDFDDDVLPAKWEQVLTGVGALATYGADTMGGVVQLATGAVANNDVVLRHNMNHISGSSSSPMFEAVFELDSVSNIRFRVGLGEYASWVTNMARPVAGLFLELDTAIDGNFHLIMKTAVATQDINCGAAAIGIHRVTAILGRGNHLHVYFDGVRQGPVPVSTGIWNALVCEGVFLRTLDAVDKPTDVDMVKAGCDRV